LGLPQKASVLRDAFQPCAIGMDEIDVHQMPTFPPAFGGGMSLSRSDEKAIHAPSGDQEGRKSPPFPEVSGVPCGWLYRESRGLPFRRREWKRTQPGAIGRKAA